MRRFILLSVLFSSPLLAFSCADPKYVSPQAAPTSVVEAEKSSCTHPLSPRHCLTYRWEDGPSVGQYSSFIFKIHRPNLADGSPVFETLQGDWEIVLWMPDMGHGSVPVKIEPLDVGTYRVSRVFFNMPKKWEIRFTLKEGESVQAHTIVTLDL